jgi:hypothetical protein
MQQQFVRRGELPHIGGRLCRHLPVAPARPGGAGAGGKRGGDVDCPIADHQHAVRRHAQRMGSLPQHQWRGLALQRRVGALHGLEELQQSRCLEHRAGEHRRLVRDDDQRALPGQLGNRRMDAVEYGAAGHRSAQGRCIEAATKPRREFVGVDACQLRSRESAGDQRVGTVADPASHRVQRELRQTQLDQRCVQRVRHAAGAVDQRAVEIEGDRVEALHRCPACAPSRSAAILWR